MKLLNLSLITITALGFSACTVKKPQYDQSHQRVLEDTLNTLNIGSELKMVLPKNKKLALRSLELDKSVDIPIVAMVEDLTIRSMVDNGLYVLERDEHSLGHLVKESKGSYKESHSLDMAFDDNNVTVKTLTINELTKNAYDAKNLVATSLDSADYLVSYRILEAGVKINSLDDGFQWSDIMDQYLSYDWWTSENMIERESIFRIHVRAQNTKTGEIVFSKNYTNIGTEKMEAKLADELSDYHYDFFKSNLPMQKGDTVLAVKNSVKAEPKSFTDKLTSIFSSDDEVVDSSEQYERYISYGYGYGLSGETTLAVSFGGTITLDMYVDMYTDQANNDAVTLSMGAGYRMEKLKLFVGLSGSEGPDALAYGAEYNLLNGSFYSLEGYFRQYSAVIDTWAVAPTHEDKYTYGLMAKIGF